jgi:hypothetical protein
MDRATASHPATARHRRFNVATPSGRTRGRRRSRPRARCFSYETRLLQSVEPEALARYSGGDPERVGGVPHNTSPERDRNRRTVAFQCDVIGKSPCVTRLPEIRQTSRAPKCQRIGRQRGELRTGGENHDSRFALGGGPRNTPAFALGSTVSSARALPAGRWGPVMTLRGVSGLVLLLAAIV